MDPRAPVIGGSAIGVNRTSPAFVSTVSKEVDPLRSQRIWQVMVGGALVLGAAACGTNGAGATGAANTSMGSPAANAPTASTVSVKGGVLVDDQGLTLYEANRESAGALRCTGSCLKVWMPLVVTGRPKAGAGVTGTLGTVDRPDGRHQVTYDGIPVYSFAFDKGAGQVAGDGAKDSFGGRRFTWHAVRPAGASSPATGSGAGGYNY